MITGILGPFISHDVDFVSECENSVISSSHTNDCRPCLCHQTPYGEGTVYTVFLC